MKIRPFKALRPAPDLASMVACLPYDVMNTEEAAKMAEGNPHSFLHVIRSEIDLPQASNQYDQQVYEQAQKNLDSMIKKHTLIQDKSPSFYLYRQCMDGRQQLGIVACHPIDDYENGLIKKHEFTRPEKEKDRIRHFDQCDAHTEPVFLTYRSEENFTGMIRQYAEENEPVYDFTTEDKIQHTLWVVSDKEWVQRMSETFKNNVEALYIADGHHRTASAAKIGLKRREENPDLDPNDESQFLMAVSFPQEDLYCMEYNRVVKDLNGMSVDELLARISQHFECEPVEKAYQPKEKHEFGMLLNNHWYRLIAKPHTYAENDVIQQLDVSILQNYLLQPILGILDPRTDKRIDFVGGIRGIEELERRVQNDMELAFSMYPTTIDDLLQVADEDKIMPPKSTWFEPKLRSGIFLHPFQEY
ncbi:MAG: DUF1015 domain-containing protein [Tindallia sp. MSAO_Bac2]|nr:MAG: DUF1015 domain-containing protein [Tindallia sp. MSAO_Bac2]